MSALAAWRMEYNEQIHDKSKNDAKFAAMQPKEGHFWNDSDEVLLMSQSMQTSVMTNSFNGNTRTRRGIRTNPWCVNSPVNSKRELNQTQRCTSAHQQIDTNTSITHRHLIDAATSDDAYGSENEGNCPYEWPLEGTLDMAGSYVAQQIRPVGLSLLENDKLGDLRCGGTRRRSQKRCQSNTGQYSQSAFDATVTHRMSTLDDQMLSECGQKNMPAQMICSSASNSSGYASGSNNASSPESSVHGPDWISITITSKGAESNCRNGPNHTHTDVHGGNECDFHDYQELCTSADDLAPLCTPSNQKTWRQQNLGAKMRPPPTVTFPPPPMESPNSEQGCQAPAFWRHDATLPPPPAPEIASTTSRAILRELTERMEFLRVKSDRCHSQTL